MSTLTYNYLSFLVLSVCNLQLWHVQILTAQPQTDSPRYWIRAEVGPDSEGPCEVVNSAGQKSVGVCFGLYVGLAYCPSLNMSLKFGPCADGDICCFVPPQTGSRDGSVVFRQGAVPVSPQFCGVRPVQKAPSVTVEDTDQSINEELAFKPVRFARILGGSLVRDVTKHCWIAAILSGTTLMGSGALINSQWIVTTASSLTALHQQSNLTVRLGQLDIEGSNAADLGYKVQKVVTYPEFETSAKGFPVKDIALLQLDVPVNFIVSSRSCTACLPSPHHSSVGDSCFVAGYGVTQIGSSKIAGRLRDVDVTVLPDISCQAVFRNQLRDPTFFWDSASICAGGVVDKDSCSRDGGAPLVCTKPGFRHGRLVGLASWGISCGREHLPSVYSDLSEPAILAWINSVAGATLPTDST